MTIYKNHYNSSTIHEKDSNAIKVLNSNTVGGPRQHFEEASIPSAPSSSNIIQKDPRRRGM